MERLTISTTSEALQRYFSMPPQARVVLEAGTHSPRVSRLLARLGHEVLVANPAAVRRPGRNGTDQVDAEQLARWGRADPTMLSPIEHRGIEAHSISRC